MPNNLLNNACSSTCSTESSTYNSFSTNDTEEDDLFASLEPNCFSDQMDENLALTLWTVFDDMPESVQV
jgi:hypothetical protein